MVDYYYGGEPPYFQPNYGDCANKEGARIDYTSEMEPDEVIIGFYGSAYSKGLKRIDYFEVIKITDFNDIQNKKRIIKCSHGNCDTCGNCDGDLQFGWNANEGCGLVAFRLVMGNGLIQGISFGSVDVFNDIEHKNVQYSPWFGNLNSATIWKSNNDCNQLIIKPKYFINGFSFIYTNRSGNNNGIFQFDSVKFNSITQFFESLDKSKCCNELYDSNTPEQLTCADFGYTYQKRKCNDFMTRYCQNPDNAKNDICNCITSKIPLPWCFDKTCKNNVMAYQQPGPTCAGITDSECQQVFNVYEAQGDNIDKDKLTQLCGDMSTTSDVVSIAKNKRITNSDMLFYIAGLLIMLCMCMSCMMLITGRK